MVVEARVRVIHEGCVTRTLGRGAHAAQISADRDADIIMMHAESEEQVSRFLDDLQRMQRAPLDVVSRTPTSVVVRARHPPAGAVGTILAHGCSVLWPAVWSGGAEEYSILAPTRATLDALVRRLHHLGGASVLRVSEVPPDALPVTVPLSDLTADLTQRQLGVLLRAIELGYYDSPRRTSTEAMATEFGVTRSTLEEHLRKAERRVLERFAGVLASQPVLARAATRGPGRPARRAGEGPQ